MCIKLNCIEGHAYCMSSVVQAFCKVHQTAVVWCSVEQAFCSSRVPVLVYVCESIAVRSRDVELVGWQVRVVYNLLRCTVVPSLIKSVSKYEFVQFV